MLFLNLKYVFFSQQLYAMLNCA